MFIANLADNAQNLNLEDLDFVYFELNCYYCCLSCLRQ